MATVNLATSVDRLWKFWEVTSVACVAGTALVALGLPLLLFDRASLMESEKANRNLPLVDFAVHSA